MIRSSDSSRNVIRKPDAPVRQSGWVRHVHYMLGWFAVPIEVIFRRNFGERWFTITNFLAGLLLLGMFTGLQYLYHWLVTVAPPFLASLDLYHGDLAPEILTPLQEAEKQSMLLFLALYLLIGIFHFYRMWWRRRTGTSLHSFDDGTSWFEPLGRLLVLPINLLAMPFVYLLMPLLPKQERKLPAPALIADITSFTNIVVDPLIVLSLAFLFHDVTRVWLVFSAIATIIHATEKHIAKRDKMRDFYDTVNEAKTLHGHKQGEVPKQEAVRLKKRSWWHFRKKRKSVSDEPPIYGDTKSIINAFHKERDKHSSN